MNTFTNSRVDSTSTTYARTPHDERIHKLEAALKHAQEAIFWYGAEGFDMDGRTVKQAIDEALS